MPVVPEKREAGGAQVAVCWKSCGGLGGNARFTMVSRGPVPKIGAALTMGYCQIAFDFDIIRVEKKYALFLNDWHGKRVGKELD